MPIATAGVVKTLTTAELKKLGAQIILANTYHLMLRPGEDLVKKSGGLHEFMNWPGPILTDSGGFQIFSLSKIRKITDSGVEFHSPVDGKKHILTPAKTLKIQQKLDVDIAMILDECVGYPATRGEVEKAVERTTLWARTSKNQKANQPEAAVFASGVGQSLAEKQKNNREKINPNASCLMTHDSLTFAINQGGIYKDLRLKSARDLTSLNFDGYAIGGLAVGEPWPKALKVLDWVGPELPTDKPRYLMGVGYPEQIIQAVERGIDMFDCVIPTREGRHGRLFLWKRNPAQISNFKFLNSNSFYATSQITNSKFKRDHSPINKNSKFEELRGYSKSYLRHLFKIKEPLGARIATLNNLEFYLDLMKLIRKIIRSE